MFSELLTRLILAAGLLLLGFAAYRGLTVLVLYRARGQSSRLEHFLPGKPAILYFTTPDCAPCKTVQKPAINRLQVRLGEKLQVIEVNAYDQPELAKSWGVLSVPTTFILDSRGRPRHVNHGVMPTEKLLEQLNHVEQSLD